MMLPIKQEDVLEYAIELGERYKPKLEEMFDVDLSDVKVRDFFTLAEDLHDLVHSMDPENPRGIF